MLILKSFPAVSTSACFPTAFVYSSAKARLKKRNALRDTPRVYHQKVRKTDGSMGWQGGKNLSESAEYTPGFCKALRVIWEAEFAPLSMRSWNQRVEMNPLCVNPQDGLFRCVSFKSKRPEDVIAHVLWLCDAGLRSIHYNELMSLFKFM